MINSLTDKHEKTMKFNLKNKIKSNILTYVDYMYIYNKNIHLYYL